MSSSGLIEAVDDNDDDDDGNVRELILMKDEGFFSLLLFLKRQLPY